MIISYVVYHLFSGIFSGNNQFYFVEFYYIVIDYFEQISAV